MMLSDRIEQIILELMNKQNDGPVTLSRNELADFLGCAPSQVTYVINTRFSGNQNYIVESRRGNGGYIRIAFSPQQKAQREKVQETHKTGAVGLNKETQRKPNNRIEKNDKAADKAPGMNSQLEFERDVIGYFEMLKKYHVLSEREYQIIEYMTHMLFHVCPADQEHKMVQRLIHNLNSILEGGI